MTSQKSAGPVRITAPKEFSLTTCGSCGMGLSQGVDHVNPQWDIITILFPGKCRWQQCLSLAGYVVSSGIKETFAFSRCDRRRLSLCSKDLSAGRQVGVGREHGILRRGLQSLLGHE